jgi:hypothetical protein
LHSLVVLCKTNVLSLISQRLDNYYQIQTKYYGITAVNLTLQIRSTKQDPVDLPIGLSMSYPSHYVGLIVFRNIYILIVFQGNILTSSICTIYYFDYLSGLTNKRCTSKSCQVNLLILDQLLQLKKNPHWLVLSSVNPCMPRIQNLKMNILPVHRCSRQKHCYLL